MVKEGRRSCGAEGTSIYKYLHKLYQDGVGENTPFAATLCLVELDLEGPSVLLYVVVVENPRSLSTKVCGDNVLFVRRKVVRRREDLFKYFF